MNLKLGPILSFREVTGTKERMGRMRGMKNMTPSRQESAREEGRGI